MNTETIAAILEAAQKLEGRARSRTLSAYDVERLYAACAAHDGPVKSARVYSSEGFVPNCYRGRALITVVDAGMWGVPKVNRLGAHRSGGNGPLLTINGRAA